MNENSKLRIGVIRKLTSNKHFHYALQASALLVFIFISLGMVFSRGICCADDSWHSIVAKNLANGHGFSTSIQTIRHPQYAVQSFDPAISVGAPLILPAALVIGLVGNTYWAPGLAMVAVCTLLLVFIGVYVNRMSNTSAGAAIMVVIIFVFSYLWMKIHFEQWYALLGEIPAALFIILAILVFFERDSNPNIFLTGVLFSLATLTKVLALLAFVSFSAAIFAYLLKKDVRRRPQKLWRRVAMLALGFVLPLALYEIWKLITLGVAGEMQFWQGFFYQVRLHGLGSDILSLSSRYTQNVQTLVDHFGIYLPFLPTLFFLIAFLIRKDKKIYKLFIITGVIIAVFAIYWLFLSNGQARYYIIPLILTIFVLGLPFIPSVRNSNYLAIYGVLLFILPLGAWNNIASPIQYDGAQLYKPSANTQALLQVRDWLALRLDQRPFVTQWWATAADLEYIMDSTLNFTTHNDAAVDFNAPFILAVNSKLLNTEDKEFMIIMDRCDLHEFGPYILGECSSSQ